MKAEKFILERLENLAKKFQDFIFKYYHNDSTYSHYVEVLPHDLYKTNKDFRSDEIDLQLDFISNFPFDNLVIYGEDNLFDTENTATLISHKILYQEYLLDIYDTIFEQVFPNIKCEIVLPRSLKTSNIIGKNNYIFNDLNFSNRKENKNFIATNNKIDCSFVINVTNNKDILVAGENNYALAA